MEEIRSKKKIVHEKIPVKVYNDSEEASKAVAHEIALLIKRKKNGRMGLCIRTGNRNNSQVGL